MPEVNRVIRWFDHIETFLTSILLHIEMPGAWPYCSELATLENALLAFDPIKRTVPTTRTRITANITAYSAMSCPASSNQSLRISLDICSPSKTLSSI